MLDCATGTGEITQAVNLTGEYHQIWVNDVSQGMLNAARTTITPTKSEQAIHFLNSDIFLIEQHDKIARFDVILCLGLIAHVGRLDELFAMFGRLLNSKGTVVLQTTVSTHFGVRAARLVNDRRVAIGGLHQIHYFSLPQIVGIANAAGFRVVTVKRFGVCLPFGDKLLGKLNYAIERRLARGASRWGGDAIIILERDLP